VNVPALTTVIMFHFVITVGRQGYDQPSHRDHEISMITELPGGSEAAAWDLEAGPGLDAGPRAGRGAGDRTRDRGPDAGPGTGRGTGDRTRDRGPDAGPGTGRRPRDRKPGQGLDAGPGIGNPARDRTSSLGLLEQAGQAAVG
jgi:hypothetical protein